MLKVTGWDGSLCLRCEKRLIEVRDWVAAPKLIRSALKRDGYARSGGRGLCAACHQYVRTGADDLSVYVSRREGAEILGTWTLCIRCGASRRTNGLLCLDCADVTTDLGERQLWAAQPA